MSKPKNKQFWLDWVENYKSYKCLWDRNCEDFTNRERRSEAWQELAELVGPEADEKFVKKRLNNFRVSYKKEVMKVNAARENGMLYKPKLFYYDLLNSFMLEDKESIENPDQGIESSSEEEDPFGSLHPTSRTTLKVKYSVDRVDQLEQHSAISVSNNKKKNKDNSKIRNNEQNSSDVDLNDSSTLMQRKDQNSSHTQIRKKRRYSTRYSAAQNNKSSSEENEDEVIKKIPKQKEDEWDTLGRRFGSHFRNMTPTQRLLAEKIISDICIYARLNQLTFQSGLTLEIPPDYQHFNTLSYSGNQSSEEQMETEVDQDSRDD